MDTRTQLFPIDIYSTYYCFSCKPNGDISSTCTVKNFIRQLEEHTYNPRTKMWQVMYRYCFYDKEKQILYLPVNTLSLFIKYMQGSNLIPQKRYRAAAPCKDVTFSIRSKFNLRDKQMDLFRFLVDTDDRFKAIAARTGIGKTFCALAAAASLGKVTLVLTMGLVKQWYKEALEKTTLKKHEIYVIQGNASISKLLVLVKNGYQPKLIIASIRTMAMYAKCENGLYKQYPPFPTFLEMLGIGVKITDECHMNFYANITIDLRSNVWNNIYLSATYERSNTEGERIFSQVFPSEIRYGEHIVAKYTTTIMVAYTLDATLDEQAFMTPSGYAHVKFESMLLKNKTLLKRYTDLIMTGGIQAYYLRCRQLNQRCLVLCSTVEMVKAMADAIHASFPELKVLCYCGSDDITVITKDIDVVVSTDRKSGVGFDLKGLKVAINTISYKSSPLAKQMMGRLRQIPGEDTYYLDFYCRDLPTHVRHARSRSIRYKDLALHYQETSM